MKLTLLCLFLAWNAVAQVPPPPPMPSAAKRPPAPVMKKPVPAKQAVKAAITAPTATAIRSPDSPDVSPELPVYFVNDDPGPPPWIFPTDGTNILLIIPASAPVLFIPNKSKAPFARLETSSRITKGWQTIAFFTNHSTGFYLVEPPPLEPPFDVQKFYKLTPENP